MFKSGMMKLDVSTPVARWIMFWLVLICIAIIAFNAGRIYQIEAMFAPRPNDSIIDGTCRAILKEETEKETGYEAAGA